jgi:hypothetical protein
MKKPLTLADQRLFAFLVVMGRKWNPPPQPRNHAGFSRIWHLCVV